MTSSGFCLLNTVAVAAAFARYNYSMGVEGECVRGHPAGSRPLRVAIVDIDVHHGNGTEEIVKNLSPHMTYLPLPSSWAPVGSVSYKPWLNEQDSDDVFFSSINLFAEDRFYPCSGRDSDPPPAVPARKKAASGGGDGLLVSHSHGTRRSTSNSNSNSNSNSSGDKIGPETDEGGDGLGADTAEHFANTAAPRPDTDRLSESVLGRGKAGNIVNIAMTPIGPGPWDAHGRSKLTAKQREGLCRKASRELREKVSRSLLPKLRAFSADLLLFSSGFDAHYDDLYHFLTEEDYHWLTSEIMYACRTPLSCGGGGFGGDGCESAGRRSRGRVVSVLEGGYSLCETAPAQPAKKPAQKKGASKGTDAKQSPPRSRPFAVHDGDGGLVKGVLAHVAALAGTDDWEGTPEAGGCPSSNA